MISAEQFRLGMRRLPAAVTLVTCKFDGDYYGLTATAVTSLSADPPSLLTCVNREASAHRAILESQGVRHQRAAARQGRSGAAVRVAHSPRIAGKRFTSDKWIELATGAPILNDAIVGFDCTLDQAIVYASHSILIGQVQDIKIADSHKHLMYLEGEFADLALGTADPDRKYPAAWSRSNR